MGIRPILVSHLGILERKREDEKRRRREEEEKKKRKKSRKVWKPCFCMETMMLYANYLCIDHYGFCMDTVCPIF